MVEVKFFLILIFSFFNAEDAQSMEWFRKIGCEELKISDFETIASKKPKQQIVIKDLDYIRSFQFSINQLPTAGDIVKDMAESARYTALEFKCGDQNNVIEFFDELIKTPTNSFYSRSANRGVSIWTEIENLFSSPKNTGVQIPYYKGAVLNFGEFSLTYLGAEDRTLKGTTASSFAQEFKLSSKTHNLDKMLTVFSGQLSPRPVEFEVNKKIYSLHTFLYRDKKIYPRHLLISEK